MFKLTAATVHYGTSSYPLNGIPERLQTIYGADDPKLDELEAIVGRLTSYRRPFSFRHIARQEFPGITDQRTGKDMIIPEHIWGSANGYSAKWEKVA